MVRKVLRHYGSSANVEHACGRIGDDPGTSGNSKPGSDPSTPSNRKPRLDVSIDAPCKACARDDAIQQLVTARHAYANRTNYIHNARDQGLTNAQIGEALGMTEAGVRMALKRAGG